MHTLSGLNGPAVCQPVRQVTSTHRHPASAPIWSLAYTLADPTQSGFAIMTRLVIPLCVLLLSACASSVPRQSPAVVPAVTVPATASSATAPAAATAISSAIAAPVATDTGPRPDDNLNAVAWTQTAIEHHVIYREVYRDAQDKLLQALHDPHWDALAHDERGNKLQGLKPAVVLDIDETTLDNSPYEARLIRDHRAYSDATWAAWVKEEKARALPGAVAFTRFAAAHGIAVIYLSNRDKSLDAATLANLRQQGFPVSGPDAFLGLGTVVPGCKQIGTQKTCRRQRVAAHYRVLMQFGDQLGDFLSVSHNTVPDRTAAVKPYLGWFGERWFMLPNPTYGDWQPALFNNDWSQSPQQRRKETLDVLRYH